MKSVNNYLTEDESRALVEEYLEKERVAPSTQELLNSGAVPRLKGYIVRPGKVSDSIFGGKGHYQRKDGTLVEFENPLLQTHTWDTVPLRIMIRFERISTHDINRGEIPFKDQILALNHNYMRRLLQDTLGTSQFDVPGLADHDIVIAAENLRQIAFENVLRAYMAKSTTSTSLYQAYIRGESFFCGHILPRGLIPNGKLPYVMDTPSTKSDEHDESISPRDLVDSGLCAFQHYQQIRNASLVAFGMVSEFLRQKGIIAVDTKTEHGINFKGEIVSQDEIWTMDSSRFWLLDDYQNQLEKLSKGEITELNPKSYSKEFARGFSEGEKGYTEEQRIQISVRYIQGIQHLLGRRFEADVRSREERMISGLQTIVERLVA